MKHDIFYTVNFRVKNKNACGGKITFKFFGKNMKQFFDTQEEAEKEFKEAVKNGEIRNVVGFSIYKCIEVQKTIEE